MEILVLGVNFKTTPIEIREKFNIPPEKRAALSMSILENGAFCEMIPIFTCNRTEIYVYSAEQDDAVDLLCQILCDHAHVSLNEMKKYFYFYQGKHAVKHLFEVSSGLDSMLVGEDEILRQVKDAVSQSQEKNFSGRILNTLFRYSITSAKKIKSSTSISSNMTSMSSISAKVAQDFWNGTLENRSALIIGVGQAGLATLNHLLARGIRKIYITNRTHERASSLTATNDKLQCVDYSRRYEVMNDADIIISCTLSPQYTITKDMLDSVLLSGKTHHKLFIDLAVPRDIDPDIRLIPGVSFVNVDELGQIASANLDMRNRVADSAREIIQSYIHDFEKWYISRKSVEFLQKVGEVSDHLVNARLSKFKGKMGDARHEELLSQAVHSTAKDFLNTFIYSIKENCSVEDIEKFYMIMDKSFRENHSRWE